MPYHLPDILFFRFRRLQRTLACRRVSPMQGEGTVQLRVRGLRLRALVTGPAWFAQGLALGQSRVAKGRSGGLRHRTIHLWEVLMG